MLEIDHIYLPIFLSMAISVLLWSILNLLIKNKYKSSIITSLIVVLFFSYGHISIALGEIPEKNLGVSTDLYVSLNFVIIFCIITYLIIKFAKTSLQLTAILNLISFGLLVYPVFIISQSRSMQSNKQNLIDFSLTESSGFQRPDIYYIILDGYGREDVLKSVYGYDNKNFLNELEKRGFYIATKSCANYSQTLLSLSSTLNMNYLDSSVASANRGNYRRYLSSTILNNQVAGVLRQIGYKFITFATGYSGTEIKNSDLYISPIFSLDEFQFMIIGTTPLYKLLELVPNKSPIYLHRQRILYTIDKIPKVNIEDRPLFLFAHIVAPHPPFVFGNEKFVFSYKKNSKVDFFDGSHYHSFNMALQHKYKSKYITQLVEINKLIINMLDRLMANKKKDIIIILQSDHGPGLLLNWDSPSLNTYSERMPILNAYYFPDNNSIALNDSITPVNTFRLIFNHFFKEKYEILENRNYFSTWLNPHEFISIDTHF